MMSFEYELRRLQIYKITRKINPLMYTYNIKVFAKMKKKIKTLPQTIRTLCQDAGMEFGQEKCIIMKSGKRETAEGIDLLNEENIKPLGEKVNYKYLRKLKADTIKQAEMKKKIRNQYLKKHPRNQALQ